LFPDLAGLLWGMQELRTKLQDVLSNRIESFDFEYDAPGHPSRIFRVNGCCVLDQNEPWLLLMIEDITVRKSAERLLEMERDRLSGQVHSTAEALDSTQQELRALAARLFQTQEDERRRVARELHDDIGQKLALLEIDIETFRQSFPDDPNAARARLHELKGRITSLSADVRALSHGLHPSVLDDLGLAQALKDLVEEFGKHDTMLVTFTKRRVPKFVPRAVAAALYRITQEALRNVAKHAGKTHVKVSLDGTDGALRLTVRDFGDGFDAGAIEHRGLGLVTMEERARLINGKFSVESQLGEGATVTVIVPVAVESVED
jgi:two-component system CheB/CheR fusion protein